MTAITDAVLLLCCCWKLLVTQKHHKVVILVDLHNQPQLTDNLLPILVTKCHSTLTFVLGTGALG